MRTGMLSRLGLLLVVLAAAAGCGEEDNEQGTRGGGTGGGGVAPGSAIKPTDFEGARVTIGSKEFTEQLVLGQITVEALKAGGALVRDATGIEGSEATRDALTSRKIDMYWEYTGTAQLVHLHRQPIPDADRQYREVAAADKANGITWLDPAPANNAFALAVRREARRPLEVTTISDLKGLVNRRPQDAALCLAKEFAERSDGLPGIEKAYGFRYPTDLLVRIDDEGEIYGEIARGARCTFGEVFLTDGRIVSNQLVVLDDDKDAFTSYHPSLNVRTDVLRKYPALRDLFDEVASKLDTDTLRSLNARVDVDGEAPDAVARSFLDAQGFTG